MYAAERKLRDTRFRERVLAEPPPGSGLRPVTGDGGMPVLGHMIEMFMNTPDYLLHIYHTGPGLYAHSPSCRRWPRSDRTPRRRSTPTATRDCSQGWKPGDRPVLQTGADACWTSRSTFITGGSCTEAFTRARLAQAT